MQQAEYINHIQSTARKTTKTPLGRTTPNIPLYITLCLLYAVELSDEKLKKSIPRTVLMIVYKTVLTKHNQLNSFLVGCRHANAEENTVRHDTTKHELGG